MTCSLTQNTSSPDPESKMSTKGELDLGQVREDVKALLDNPSWDDGSLAPILVGGHTQYGL